MGVSLVDFITSEYNNLKQKYYTNSELLKKRIDTYYPSLSSIVDLENRYHANGKISLQETVFSYFNADQNALDKKFECVRYSNVIDEAEKISEHLKQVNEQIVVVTKNSNLISTIKAILCIDNDSDLILEKELWIESANSIFLLNKIAKINHCCNHDWVTDSMKSSLFYKNHLIRNQIIGQFNSYGSRINHNKIYKFQDLFEIHYGFLSMISRKPIERRLDNLHNDKEVTVYEYIKIVQSFFQEKIKEVELNCSGKISIVSPEELPFIEGEKSIWLAGISCEDPIDPRFLVGIHNIFRVSYSSFSNGQLVYPQVDIISKIIDDTNEYESYYYEYMPPKPKLAHRKNSFAINHITKLLNNPHNFYVENILKLKPYNFHPNHIIGIMVHSIFEELIKNISELKDFEEFNNRMNLLLKQNYFNKIDFITVSKKVQIMLKNLWSLVKGADNLYAEHEGVQTIMHKNQSYYLHGRADLLYQKDDKWGIIDFKTGTPPSWINIINGFAPQISVGMLMLRFGGFLGKEVEQLADSGFISPKGLFVVSSNSSVIQSAIDGIKAVIVKFWEEESPYHIHINDPNWPYRSIARSHK